VVEPDDDNDDFDNNTTLEEVSVQQHEEQEAMLAEVQVEAKESDSIRTADMDGCIPLEIPEAAVRAALDKLMRQWLSNEHSENEENESGVPFSE
jgi:hypothetical protein